MPGKPAAMKSRSSHENTKLSTTNKMKLTETKVKKSRRKSYSDLHSIGRRRSNVITYSEDSRLFYDLHTQFGPLQSPHLNDIVSNNRAHEEENKTELKTKILLDEPIRKITSNHHNEKLKDVKVSEHLPVNLLHQKGKNEKHYIKQFTNNQNGALRSSDKKNGSSLPKRLTRSTTNDVENSCQSMPSVSVKTRSSKAQSNNMSPPDVSPTRQMKIQSHAKLIQESSKHSGVSNCVKFNSEHKNSQIKSSKTRSAIKKHKNICLAKKSVRSKREASLNASAVMAIYYSNSKTEKASNQVSQNNSPSGIKDSPKEDKTIRVNKSTTKSIQCTQKSMNGKKVLESTTKMSKKCRKRDLIKRKLKRELGYESQSMGAPLCKRQASLNASAFINIFTTDSVHRSSHVKPKLENLQPKDDLPDSQPSTPSTCPAISDSLEEKSPSEKPIIAKVSPRRLPLKKQIPREIDEYKFLENSKTTAEEPCVDDLKKDSVCNDSDAKIHQTVCPSVVKLSDLKDHPISPERESVLPQRPLKRRTPIKSPAKISLPSMEATYGTLFKKRNENALAKKNSGMIDSSSKKLKLTPEDKALDVGYSKDIDKSLNSYSCKATLTSPRQNPAFVNQEKSPKSLDKRVIKKEIKNSKQSNFPIATVVSENLSFSIVNTLKETKDSLASSKTSTKPKPNESNLPFPQPFLTRQKQDGESSKTSSLTIRTNSTKISEFDKIQNGSSVIASSSIINPSNKSFNSTTTDAFKLPTTYVTDSSQFFHNNTNHYKSFKGAANLTFAQLSSSSLVNIDQNSTYSLALQGSVMTPSIAPSNYIAYPTLIGAAPPQINVSMVGLNPTKLNIQEAPCVNIPLRCPNFPLELSKSKRSLTSNSLRPLLPISSISSCHVTHPEGSLQTKDNQFNLSNNSAVVSSKHFKSSGKYHQSLAFSQSSIQPYNLSIDEKSSQSISKLSPPKSPKPNHVNSKSRLSKQTSLSDELNDLPGSNKMPKASCHLSPQPVVNSPNSKLKVPYSNSLSSNWKLVGEPFEKFVFTEADCPPVNRMCYRSAQHTNDGMLIKINDDVFLRSGTPDGIPYVARITAFYVDESSGGKMMALLWYYRPEHTDQGREQWNIAADLYASRHRDKNPLQCIEDKAYVLAPEVYARFMADLKRREEGRSASFTESLIPYSEGEFPEEMTTENVFLCRAAYDYKQRRRIKHFYTPLCLSRSESLSDLNKKDDIDKSVASSTTADTLTKLQGSIESESDSSSAKPLYSNLPATISLGSPSTSSSAETERDSNCTFSVKSKVETNSESKEVAINIPIERHPQSTVSESMVIDIVKANSAELIPPVAVLESEAIELDKTNIMKECHSVTIMTESTGLEAQKFIPIECPLVTEDKEKSSVTMPGLEKITQIEDSPTVTGSLGSDQTNHIEETSSAYSTMNLSNCDSLVASTNSADSKPHSGKNVSLKLNGIPRSEEISSEPDYYEKTDSLIHLSTSPNYLPQSLNSDTSCGPKNSRESMSVSESETIATNITSLDECAMNSAAAPIIDNGGLSSSPISTITSYNALSESSNSISEVNHPTIHNGDDSYSLVNVSSETILPTSEVNDDISSASDFENSYFPRGFTDDDVVIMPSIKDNSSANCESSNSGNESYSFIDKLADQNTASLENLLSSSYNIISSEHSN